VVETSLLRTGAYVLGWDLGLQSSLGKVAQGEPREVTQTPLMNCSHTADDRWLFLTCLEADRHLRNVLVALGREDLFDDERWASGRTLRKNSRDVITVLDAEFAGRTLAEWGERLDAAGGVVGGGAVTGRRARRRAGAGERRDRGGAVPRRHRLDRERQRPDHVPGPLPPHHLDGDRRVVRVEPLEGLDDVEGLDAGVGDRSTSCRSGAARPAVGYRRGMDVRRLADVELADATGAMRRLGDFWADRPVIVVFLRHFG
jgi:hypothetical protein